MTPPLVLLAQRVPEPDALAKRARALEAEGCEVERVEGEPGFEERLGRLVAERRPERVELVTDGAGIFSADPEILPSAHLLLRLDYAEAREAVVSGGGGVDPGLLGAMRDARLPLHLRWMGVEPVTRPWPVTVIEAGEPSGPPQVKAITLRRGVVLVELEALAVWRGVGFLARAFEVFREEGVSIDLVSTSATTTTLSLERPEGELGAGVLERLEERLGRLARVRVIRGCAAVSLVGSRIRALLHRIGPVLRVFEEHRIHLVSQAASDVNLALVVDDEQAEPLLRRLHDLLLAPPLPPDTFGPTWEELTGRAAEPVRRAAPWWGSRRSELLEIAEREGSAYVYDLATVRRRASEVHALSPVDRVFYAMKANEHPEVLRAVRDAGIGLECVSLGEVRHALELFPAIDPGELLFTPNFAPREEYAAALEAGVRVTLDALHPLAHWPELFDGRELILRVDPGWGSGHHEKVVTGGQHSKFGIPVFELDEAAELAAAAGARVVGLHTHSGSGIVSAGHWARVGRFLTGLRERFPGVRALNLGGGLGVPERPGDEPLDLGEVERGLIELRAGLEGVELWLEPGRYLVAEAGVLVARVTQTKGKGAVRYIGLTTGMNSLLRPALYGAHHEIVNLSRMDETATQRAHVVGPICETGDRLGMDRILAPTHEGDVILIATAGAYGRVMASRYNRREPAVEVVLR